MRSSKFVVVVAALASSLAARAADLPCGPADKGTIRLDGLLEDWDGVDGIDAGGRDANASFTIKCNVEGSTLLLLVDVRDNYFVRTKAARPGEDHLTLTLGGRKLLVYPGDNAATHTKVTWGTKPAKGVRAASALQERGWAVEIAVPLSQVPGFKPGLPSFAYSAELADCDSKAALKTERTVETSGRIAFAEGDSALEGFLKDRSLKRGDVFWERGIALGRSSGAQVIMAGRFLAAITDGYVFVELPFRERADLKDARVLDLAGDGRQAVVLRYVERGSGGAREVLAVYRFAEDQVQRVFACEVGKSAGASKIEDKVSFIKRGKATDIQVEATSAVGFTQATFKESPAEDVIPVMLPWSDDKRARYQFHGEEYQRAP
jgi:hypothetical protein